MTKEDLIKKLEELEIGDEHLITSPTFNFGLRCDNILDTDVYIFGGMGTGIKIWDVDTFSERVNNETIANEIEEYISQFHTEGGEGTILPKLELSECSFSR